MTKKMNCCNATSCLLSVSFDFFVSSFADKPAGSSKAKLFPFGWFLLVIPFWGCVFVKDTHSWKWYRWLQIYSLPVWPSAARISCGSHNAGPDTELLNHALARTQFPPFSSSALLHPTHCITNHSPKIWFNTLQTGPYHCTTRPCPFSHSLHQCFLLSLFQKLLWHINSILLIVKSLPNSSPDLSVSVSYMNVFEDYNGFSLIWMIVCSWMSKYEMFVQLDLTKL